MKLLLIALSLSISSLSFADARLGQDPDPVAGDNSRCCRTGKCGDNMRICADTPIDADRSFNKDIQPSNKKRNQKSSKASAQ